MVFDQPLSELQTGVLVTVFLEMRPSYILVTFRFFVWTCFPSQTLPLTLQFLAQQTWLSFRNMMHPFKPLELTWSNTSWVLTVFPCEHVNNRWVTQVQQNWKTLSKTSSDWLAVSKGEEKVEDRVWGIQTVSVLWRDRGYSVSTAHGLLAWRHAGGNVLSQPEHVFCHVNIATTHSAT